MEMEDERLAKLIIESGGLEIRDLSKGEEPFLYSSGNYGPGYVDIKGRVGFDEIFELMVEALALKLLEDKVSFDFIIGLMTGGALPSYRLKQILEKKLSEYSPFPGFKCRIPYVYMRHIKKAGGHKESITGNKNNQHIQKGMTALIVEELINFADTTSNAAVIAREEGYKVNDAATILYYDNPFANERLKHLGVKIHYVFKLSDLINFAEELKIFSKEAVDDYKDFLNNPKDWNKKRGFKFYGKEE